LDSKLPAIQIDFTLISHKKFEEEQLNIHTLAKYLPFTSLNLIKKFVKNTNPYDVTNINKTQTIMSHQPPFILQQFTPPTSSQ
jgi:hypothetical protein